MIDAATFPILVSYVNPVNDNHVAEEDVRVVTVPGKVGNAMAFRRVALLARTNG